MPEDNLFPIDQDRGPSERIRVVCHISKPEHEDIEFVVTVFNAMHEALGRTSRGWAVMSVAKRMVLAGVEMFLRKYGGWPSWDAEKNRPMSPEEREALRKRAVADVRKRTK